MKWPTSKPYSTETIFNMNREGYGSMDFKYGPQAVSPSMSGPGLKTLGPLGQNSTLTSGPRSPGLTGNAAFRMAGPLGTNATFAKMRRTTTMQARRGMQRRGMS